MTSSNTVSGSHRLLTQACREATFVVTIMLTTAAIYWPVHGHPFIHLDDASYVVYNFHIRHLDWQFLRWSLTTYYLANWHPITWFSHALDYRLFGLSPNRHHEINLLLHMSNAVLLFWVLSRATRRSGASFFVAALFALHPVNVESVAWVAERKNLLSMFFFLLALGAYHAYARKPRLGPYLTVAALFALGLMCKPQIITLPFVLLLWDYWPLSRFSPFAIRCSPETPDRGCSREERSGEQTGNREQRISGEKRMANGEWRTLPFLVLEKLPLLALCVSSAALTLKAQRAGGTLGGPFNTFTLASRLGNAVVAYVRYLGQAIWPAHLAAFYPHLRTAPPAWEFVAAGVSLLVITALAIADRKRRYLAVGWLWFLGTMIPMIGLVQVGHQAMADRYAYLPFVGLFIAASWGIADWAGQWRSSAIWLPAGAGVVLLLLALATRRQLSYWSDEPTLWTHSAAVVKNNYLAENLIGEALLRNGNPKEALGHFRASAAMEPLFSYPRMHIAIYEEEHWQPNAAIQHLQEVLDLTKDDSNVTNATRSNILTYMSFAYSQLGDHAHQEECLEMAARLQELPDAEETGLAPGR